MTILYLPKIEIFICKCLAQSGCLINVWFQTFFLGLLVLLPVTLHILTLGHHVRFNTA